MCRQKMCEWRAAPTAIRGGWHRRVGTVLLLLSLAVPTEQVEGRVTVCNNNP